MHFPCGRDGPVLYIKVSCNLILRYITRLFIEFFQTNTSTEKVIFSTTATVSDVA